MTTEEKCTYKGLVNIDKRGNLVKSERDGKVVAEYTYDATNKLVHGVMENKEENKYIYNGLGDLVGNDSLVWGTVSGGINIEASGVLACDDTYPLVVYDPASGLVRVKKDYVLDYTSALKNVIMDGSTRYTYGLQKVSSSKKVYYHHDRLGSTDYTTDTAGVVVNHVTYDDWGMVTGGDTSIAEYTGHMWDNVLGMYYARARMYSAENRRFVNVDLIPGGVDNMLSANRYLYCLDNPIRYVDLTGLKTVVTIGRTEVKTAEEYNGVMFASLKELAKIYGFSVGANLSKYTFKNTLSSGHLEYVATLTVGSKTASYVTTSSYDGHSPQEMSNSDNLSGYNKSVYRKADSVYISIDYFNKMMCSIHNGKTVTKKETGLIDEYPNFPKALSSDSLKIEISGDDKKGNKISITWYAQFTGTDINKMAYNGTNDTAFQGKGTYKNVIKNAITQKWSKTSNIKIKGHNTKVTTSVVERNSGRRGIVKFSDTTGVPGTNMYESGVLRKGWNRAWDATMKLYSVDNRIARRFSYSSLRKCAAHEFGHVLGVDDGYNDPQTAQNNSIMCDPYGSKKSGQAESIDIKKALDAYYNNSYQNW